MNRQRLIVWIFFLLLCFGCSDVVKFEEKNLINNAWLKVFTPEIQTIEGTHDLDNSRLFLLLKSNLKEQKYFETIEKNALDSGWSLSFKKGGYRIFIKDMPYESGLSNPMIVKIYPIEPNLYSIESY